MNKQTIEKFSVIGIAVRTSNENGQAAQDIPALWNRFMTEQIAEKIPGKKDQSLYCIYTDYELDHTRPYTTILGCRVDNLNTVPAGMMGKTIDGGKYVRYVAEGNITHGSVFDEWTKIWNSDLQRTYTTDFEFYGEKAQDPENAAIDIFVAVK